MNNPTIPTISTSPSDIKNQRGVRIPLLARFGLLLAGLLLSGLASVVALSHFFPDLIWFIALAILLVLTPIGVILLHAQLAPILELFRAMSGTVLSYQDRDFSFGLNWSRNDELAELVDAHNALGEVLRSQRLDLVQRELLLDSMLQNSPVAMFLVGVRGHIVFANINARQLLNHGKKLEGNTLEQILRQVSDSLREAIAQGGDGLFTAQIKQNQDDNVEEHDGEDDIYHLSRRVFILNGTEHELFLIRHLTVELRRQEVQTWKKVIRVISHELNNSLAPVASLANSATALIQRGQYERLPEIMKTIEERAQHLESFIHGYARFAKLPTPRYETTSWQDFLGRLQSQMQFQVVGKLPEAEVAFDLAQMEQALLNLLKNALESGSDPAAISLEVKPIFDGLKIEVSDAGSGMSDTVMSNALVPFYSTKRHGTGLGLALAREIIEAHGGRISLNNRDSGGLTVSLILPV
ncbi:sensor histidine kinase [Undibacterium fentianense]|uniref:histidine kinase n=1 Tax=Undibacterium fentianense TaxID=2828728 RepID=A0A941E6R3_9BURK|nr:ATP-binding protein [Undibacterium fentianense]MBR7799748.1 ATP-binding protein [Undibacterium fentianense]